MVRFIGFKDHDRECFANLRDSLNKTRAQILHDEMQKAKQNQELQNTMRSLSLRALKNGDIEKGITYIKGALALNKKIYDHGMIIHVNFHRQTTKTISDLKQILPFVRFVAIESAEEKSASSLGL